MATPFTQEKSYNADWRCFDDVHDGRLRPRDAQGNFPTNRDAPDGKMQVGDVTHPALVALATDYRTRTAMIKWWRLGTDDNKPMPGWAIEDLATGYQWQIHSLGPTPRGAGYTNCFCSLIGERGGKTEL